MKTLVTFGDSTTAPRGNLRIYTDALRDVLAERASGIEVINAGVPGNTTADGRERFERDVLTHQPDLVVMQFGINDAAVDVWKSPPATAPRVPLSRYKANLAHFVEALRQRTCRVILMTPNPMSWTPALRQQYGRPPYGRDDPDGFNEVLRDYVAAVRDLARQHGIECLDVYAAFQDYGRAPGRSVGDLLLDGMHPNADGHHLVLELLQEVLMRAATEEIS
ncbi:MAG: SGNH/GDSL hydrolase family protein [Planctomycetota bacterium]|jgi:lysophospholipase L1-like esterase